MNARSFTSTRFLCFLVVAPSYIHILSYFLGISELLQARYATEATTHIPPESQFTTDLSYRGRWYF
jgi:hypothetical protein